MNFYHEYDFGTTAELDLKVVGIHPASPDELAGELLVIGGRDTEWEAVI